MIGDAACTLTSLPWLAELVEANDGVAVYGSVARGDMGPASDVDVLVVSDRATEHILRGRISVTFYQEQHLRAQACSGSLFVLHLKQEARIVKDTRGAFARIFDAWHPPDVERTLAGMRAAAATLDVPKAFARVNATELSRVTVFLVRSVLYLRCLQRGRPVFGARDVADVLGDEHIQSFLDRVRVCGEPAEILPAGRSLLDRYLGEPLMNPFGSLEALAVSCYRPFPLASDIARRLATRQGPLHYATAPASWWAP